jgi:LysM repeat protein
MPNQGRRRSAARLLAPVALLLAVGAVLVVVQSSTQSDGSDDDGGQPTAGEQTEQQTTTGSEPTRPRRASYTVKLNDTLGLISEKTGVSVERLQDLNPELDPQNLIVGQKVKLRE